MPSIVRSSILAVTAAIAIPAFAANTLFLGNAPLARMTAEDVDIFHKAAVATLETGEDGKPAKWRNPQTKAWGRLTPLNRYDGPEGPCRDLQIQNWAGGIAGSAKLSMCRTASGDWKVKTD
jgi:surface antigen